VKKTFTVFDLPVEPSKESWVISGSVYLAEGLVEAAAAYLKEELCFGMTGEACNKVHAQLLVVPENRTVSNPAKLFDIFAGKIINSED